jgi:hypothetical protein
LRIRRSRKPTNINAACRSAVFTGTGRIDGRLIAFAKRFGLGNIVFALLTYGLTS